MLTLQPYCPPSFLTEMGSVRARNALLKRGFPETLFNWRFITLTFDRNRYPDPFDAYVKGKRHLRQFVYELRALYPFENWFWKLELHEPDPERGFQIWPHWHLGVDHLYPIPWEIISGLWGKGDVHVERVRSRKLDYVFKYAAKSVEELPDWLLNLKRVRFFQCSPGMLSPAGGAATNQDSENPCSRVVDVPPIDETKNRIRYVGDGVWVSDSPERERNEVATIRERLNRWKRSVVSCETNDAGMKRYRLRYTFGETWADVVIQCCQHKFSQKLGVSEITITHRKVELICPLSIPPRLHLYQPVYS